MKALTFFCRCQGTRMSFAFRGEGNRVSPCHELFSSCISGVSLESIDSMVIAIARSMFSFGVPT